MSSFGPHSPHGVGTAVTGETREAQPGQATCPEPDTSLGVGVGVGGWDWNPGSREPAARLVTTKPCQ